MVPQLCFNTSWGKENPFSRSSNVTTEATFIRIGSILHKTAALGVDKHPPAKTKGPGTWVSPFLTEDEHTNNQALATIIFEADAELNNNLRTKL